MSLAHSVLYVCVHSSLPVKQFQVRLPNCMAREMQESNVFIRRRIPFKTFISPTLLTKYRKI